MMTTRGAILLQSSDEAAKLIALDPQTGTFTTKTNDQTGEPAPHGFAHLHQGQIAAVYPDGDHLVLQVGPRRWHLGDPKVRLELSRSPDMMANTFRVKVGDRTEYETTYASPRADRLNQADPSF